MTIDRFDIASYQSVGPVKFGMTENEVLVAIAGQPNIGKNRRNEVVFRYSGFNVVFSAITRRVVEVGLLPEVEAIIHGISVFRERDAFARILKIDGHPYENIGFIVLMGLGMTLTGFHDGDESQMAVTVFDRGRWDNLISDFKYFELKE